MKFALAFTALASAANDQAPVISLNLNSFAHPQESGRTAGHGLEALSQANNVRSNSFADECPVQQNHAPNDPGCQEPEATAYDHHDGELAVTTTYTLFVSSAPKQDAVPKAANNYVHPQSIDLTTRGEWIIKYDAQDADGNEAETLTFALILNDEIEPGCGSAQTPGCYTGSSGYRTYNGDNTMTIELCANDLDNIVWAPTDQTKTQDLYDGELDATNSVFFSGLKTVGSHTPIANSASVVPKDQYTGITSPKTLNYDIHSEDFAGIFGQGNKNNKREETGTITLQDTTAPTIQNPNWPSFWECGYQPAKDSYRLATAGAYTDCYDDWSGASTKSNVRVQVSKDSAAAFDLDDGHSTGYENAQLTQQAIDLFGSAGHATSGSLELHYSVSDTNNNAATDVTHTIALQDNIPPTLYITQVTGAVGTANAHGDKCVGGVTAESTAGNTFTAEHCTTFTDADGHTTYTHATADTTHHESSLDDETQIQHSAGYAADYQFIVDLMVEGTGYKCFDACSSTTTSVEWHTSCDSGAAGDKFNMENPGTYFLKYSCKDHAGHETTACRTFINVDKTRPVITVLEAANQNDGTYQLEASRDSNYVDAGATCSDMVDGNISQDVEVSGDVVNMAAPGTYKITYNCVDSADQSAIPAVRTVVVKDTTCPTCAVPGGVEEVTVEASFPYTEEDAACTDTLDGALSAQVYGQVDVEQTGTYVLTYSVTDNAGNGKDPTQCDELAHRGHTHFMKTVVVQDTMIPIISLNYKGSQLMAESTSSVNGWVIGAVASAVSGVALLGYAATRKSAVATSVPV